MTLENNLWKVEALGSGVYLFRWFKGFYLSLFLVTGEGVVATDPIDAAAARAYRQAIRSVTDAPIRAIIYSHDHRDHIVGAAELSETAEVFAHPNAKTRIERRKDRDIRVPQTLISDGDVLQFGKHKIEARYFGPNHSDSNLAMVTETGNGRLLVFVDTVEPGVAPYRDLPDTDFAGTIDSLKAAETLDFKRVIGGHCGPEKREWVTWYREYLEDLRDATRSAFEKTNGQTPLSGEDGVHMTERIFNEVCRAAAAAIKPKYGHWRGFEQWAPMTANRILMYLIMGN